MRTGLEAARRDQLAHDYSEVSQILHGVVEQGVFAHLSESWDVGLHKERSFPPRIVRLLWSAPDDTSSEHDTAVAAEDR